MATNNSQYTPVSCAQHSELELAIMRSNNLQVSWKDERGNQQDSTLMPTDLLTEHGCEYLVARGTDCNDKKIRLDMIIEAYPVETQK